MGLIVKKHSRLYARDTIGGFKQWYVFVELRNGIPFVVTQYGKVNGTITETAYEAIGKNLERSNATTAQEQAEKEAKAMWTEKRNRDSYYSLEDLGYEKPSVKQTQLKLSEGGGITTLLDVLEKELPVIGMTINNFMLPMKAQPYWHTNSKGQNVTHAKFPMLGQPKLNGVRCKAMLENGKVVLCSKRGVYYNQMHHISADLQQLKGLFEANNLELDGELYCHDMPLNEIVSAVRVWSISSQTIKFVVFDIFNKEVKQEKRLAALDLLKIDFVERGIGSVKVLRSTTIYDQAQALAFKNNCIAKGYEGAIFRDPKAVYAPGKKVSTMLKWKNRLSAEFQIVDIIDTQKAPGLAMFICLNDMNENTFAVVPEGSHQLRAEYFANAAQLIGKQVTVEFYERTTDKQLPFNAVATVIRDYE